MQNMKNILVPTDFSENSDLAIEKAIECAATCDATLHLAYVMPDAPNIFKLSKYMEKGRQQIQDELEKSCEIYFEKQISRSENKEDVKIKTHVQNGIPFKEILRLEKKLKPDLIVITAQGESALEEVIFGGTANKVIRYSISPVLLVKKPKYAKKTGRKA